MSAVTTTGSAFFFRPFLPFFGGALRTFFFALVVAGEANDQMGEIVQTACGRGMPLNSATHTPGG